MKTKRLHNGQAVQPEIPDRAHARVDRTKIVDYLLSPTSGIVETAYGLRYTVDGPMRAPDGRAPWVRTVWIVERGSTIARLITAHPM